MELLLRDDFSNNIIDPQKWEIHPWADVPIFVENQELWMKTEEGQPKVIGVLLGKVNNNFLFLNPTKDFVIKHTCRILKDDVLVAAGTGFENAPESVMAYTKVVDGVRYLYGGVEPVEYHNEKIIVEYTYNAVNKIWNKRMRLEYDDENTWRLNQFMNWESTQLQGLILLSWGGGQPIEHHSIFDDIEVYGTYAEVHKKRIRFVIDGKEADEVMAKSIKKLGNEVIDISQTSFRPLAGMIPIANDDGKLNDWVDVGMDEEKKNISIVESDFLTESHHTVLARATNTNTVITLPSGVFTGKEFFIKRIDNNANIVKIVGQGGITIDGEQEVTLDNQYQFIKVKLVEINGIRQYIIIGQN